MGNYEKIEQLLGLKREVKRWTEGGHGRGVADIIFRVREAKLKK